MGGQVITPRGGPKDIVILTMMINNVDGGSHAC